MGLANKALEVQDLLDDDTDIVSGIDIDGVLRFMKENKIIKIVKTGEQDVYRLVFPIDVSKKVYQRKIKK